MRAIAKKKVKINYMYFKRTKLNEKRNLVLVSGTRIAVEIFDNYSMNKNFLSHSKLVRFKFEK